MASSGPLQRNTYMMSPYANCLQEDTNEILWSLCAEVKATFDPVAPLILHWGGKIMKNCTGHERKGLDFMLVYFTTSLHFLLFYLYLVDYCLTGHYYFVYLLFHLVILRTQHYAKIWLLWASPKYHSIFFFKLLVNASNWYVGDSLSNTVQHSFTRNCLSLCVCIILSVISFYIVEILLMTSVIVSQGSIKFVYTLSLYKDMNVLMSLCSTIAFKYKNL